MGKPFFGADGGYGLLIRVQVHIIPSFVPIANGMSQLGNTHGSGIPVVVAFFRGLNQFINDMFWGGNIGISHTKIDDILSPASRLHFDLIHGGKDIGGQSAHSHEFLHGLNLLKRFRMRLVD